MKKFTKLLLVPILICVLFITSNGQITYAVIGDFGSGNDNETAVADLVKSWNPQFVITTGDDRYGSTTFDLTIGRDYCEFLAGAQSGTYCNGNGASINSFFPSAGNHEYSDGQGINEYLDYFNLPGSGVVSSNTSGSEKYYDFVQGPIHFFVIDSHDAISNGTMTTQKNWLQAQLSASTSIWNIVYFHHPPYSSSSNHGSSTSMRWPFSDWGADAVLNGHDHTYERLIVDGFPYMVNGLGGMSKYGFGTPLSESIIQYSAEYGAQLVVADEYSMTFSFINIKHELIDEYTIYKTSPPVVSISSPLNNTHYDTPQTIVVSAEASDSDGTIDQVEFFVNGASIGTDNTSPFSANWEIPSNGAYTIIAKATDNLGVSKTSSPVNITVGVFNQLVSSQISSGIDDVEESDLGVMYTTSSDIELVYDSYTTAGNQTVGLRFTNLNIPQGVSILNASIQFAVDEISSDDANLTIFGHDIDDSPVFTTSSFSVSGRNKTSASVNWIPPVWNNVGAAEADQRTPDLSSIIQEIVDRPGYSASNAISIIITGTGTRTAEAYEGDPALAAILNIEYSTSTSLNTPPSFISSSISKIDAIEDTVYSASIATDASDDDGDALTFSKVTGPAWLTVGTNGNLSGTPLNENVGLNSWTVQVSDGKGGTDQTVLQITVINTNDAPVFENEPISLADGTVAAQYNGSIAGSATDDDNDNLAYSIVSGPEWLNLNPDGSLSGVPLMDDAGQNSWIIEVSDENNATDQATLKINIIDPSNVTYCLSSSQDFSLEYISNLVIGNFENISSGSEYSDFTSQTIELESGQNYNIEITPSISGKRRREFVRVWIDYNMNGNFSDPGELVFDAPNIKSATSGSINIPANISGKRRMRVSLKYNSTPDPCETFQNGEVEDYTITIGFVIPQAPIADFSANKISVYAGDFIQFTDLSTNNPTSWSWDFGDGRPSVTEQNPLISYSEVGTYSITLTASNNEGNDSETKIGYIDVMKAPEFTYCEPANINNTNDWINQISIDNISSSSGKSITGFTHFSSPEFDFDSGQTYSVNLNPYNNKNRNFWRIWIDANGDGDFEDANEILYSGNNKRGAVSATITIPSDILVTNTLIRIAMKTGSSPSPCENNYSGEVEDYNANILNIKSAFISSSFSPTIEEISAISFKVYPNPATDKLFVRFEGWDGVKEIKLMDITGKSLYINKLNEEYHEIDISNLPNGIYLIDARNDSFHEIKKIKIQ